MDIDQRIDSLEQRLSAMERKSRAWRILALLLLVALIGGAASEGVFDNSSWAADEKNAKEKVTKFDVVEAKTLRIRASNGATTCRITTMFGSVGSFELIDPVAKDVNNAGTIRMRATTFNAGNSDAILSVSGGANSQTSSISVTDDAGMLSMSGARLRLTRKADSDERQRLSLKNATLRGKLAGADLVRFRELNVSGFATEMGIGRTGGYVFVNNQFLKPVVSLQSDKTNQGGVYIFDVNGKLRNALTVP